MPVSISKFKKSDISLKGKYTNCTHKRRLWGTIFSEQSRLYKLRFQITSEAKLLLKVVISLLRVTCSYFQFCSFMVMFRLGERCFSLWL